MRELVFIPPPDELAEIRARVSGKPMHPERPLLEAYERRLKTGKPDTSARQVWRIGTSWRFSKSYTMVELPYWDFASGPEGAWHMTPQKLTVVPQSLDTGVGREIASESSGMTLEANLLVTGGLVSAGALGVEVNPRVLLPSRWSAEGTKVDEHRTIVLQAEGAWDAVARVGTVDRCELRITAVGQPDIAESYRAEGWEYQPKLQLGVAGVVTQFDAMGRPDIRYRRVVVEEFDETRFKELVRVPRLDVPDPIRGTLSVTSISDARPGMAASWVPQGASFSESTAVAQSRTHIWQVAGWLIAGLLLLTLVLLRIHASRKPGADAPAPRR